MGKKNENKISGAARTAIKEKKNSEKKLMKEIKDIGEDNVEQIVTDYQKNSIFLKTASEVKCTPPSPRSNMTLNAHPEKDLLIMFGGEFFNGKKTSIYNDLFYYHIRNNEWSQLILPNAPAPRCSHQALTMPHMGCQLWIFGGEFVTSTESQYYHFNELWMLNLAEKTWNKIEGPGGPSSRSGHRMVACRKMLFIFGGFHDNSKVYKYYNDLHAFNVETMQWIHIEVSGIPPCPRSGCVMAVTQDQCNIMVYGGYSKEKVKKDVDKGNIYSDMYMLSVDVGKNKQDLTNVITKWKWVLIKQSGNIPIPRCSSSLVPTSSNRVVLFGGVNDEEEDDENVEGHCLNDMYSLEVDKGKWHLLTLRKPNENTETKKRRKIEKMPEYNCKKTTRNSSSSDSSSDEEGKKDISFINNKYSYDDVNRVNILDKNVKKLKFSKDFNEKSSENKTESEEKLNKDSEDIFTITIGPSLSFSNKNSEKDLSNFEKETNDLCDSFFPCPRMRPMLAAKRGLLYLYGGMKEEGDREITLADFYSIDVQKMDKWNTIIALEDVPMEWEMESDEESDSSDNYDSEDMDNDHQSDSDDVIKDGPDKFKNENFISYFERSNSYWKEKASTVAQSEAIEASEKQILKAASKMAKEFWDIYL